MSRKLEASRALLDQLMGKHRNVDPNDRPKQLKYSDPDVCKYFICGFCPHELFVNTKSHLGDCKWSDHDIKMQEQFNKASESEKQPHMNTFIRYLESLLEEADARVRREKIRLELPPVVTPGDPAPAKAPDHDENMAKLDKAKQHLRTLEAQMTELGEVGKVAESQALLKLAEGLNAEIAQLEGKVKAGLDPAMIAGTNRMRVCEVCGIFTSNNPEDSRAQSHMTGKQHMGFQKIRDFVAENKLRYEKPRREPENIAYRKDDRSRDAPKQRERSRSPRRDREERSSRDTRDRDRRDRSRDHDRRDKSKRSRSRSSDRRRRDRSRSRDRRR
jgi:hypothetical protein